MKLSLCTSALALALALAPSSRASAQAATEPAPDMGVYAGGSLIGVGVITAILTGWSAAQVASVNDDPRYIEARFMSPGSSDICATPAPGSDLASLCSHGLLHENLQFVFGAVSLLSLGFGVGLLVAGLLDGGDDEPEAALRLLPAIGPEQAGLLLDARF